MGGQVLGRGHNPLQIWWYARRSNHIVLNSKKNTPHPPRRARRHPRSEVVSVVPPIFFQGRGEGWADGACSRANSRVLTTDRNAAGDDIHNTLCCCRRGIHPLNAEKTGGYISPHLPAGEMTRMRAKNHQNALIIVNFSRVPFSSPRDFRVAAYHLTMSKSGGPIGKERHPKGPDATPRDFAHSDIT
jgi:hypothetical protein